MKYTFSLFFLMVMCCGLWSSTLTAQNTDQKSEENKKLRFNGLGRTTLAQTDIDGNILDADSSTIKRLTDGEFLLDLVVNATPNDKTEVQTIIRLRNEFGGFFGAGTSVEVRELWARGIIADVIKYRVGDMDVVMSPYTLFSPDEEGTVNEAAIFAPQKEVIAYEQFYQDDNTRRLQGAKLDFGLDFSQGLEDMNLMGFVARIRGTDFFTVPTRLIAGGQADFSTPVLMDSLGLKADFGVNLVHTFDDLQSGEANSGIRNTVLTGDFDVRIIDRPKMGLHLVGETGQSQLVSKADSVTVFEERDNFLDIGLKLHLKAKKLSLSAAFIDVGPDFFSMGAQSKRIDYEATKSYYHRVGLDQNVRMPSLFDLSRDRSLYTFRLSDQLMPYDPRYSNTLPYGTATPNRRGLRFGLDYGEADGKIEAKLTGALLQEIRGQGTFELKDFTLLRAAANINLHKILSWKRALRLSLGYQYETVARGGTEIEQVDLNSNLLEIGLEAELFSKFDLLFGAKTMTAKGKEYIPELSGFNDVKDFPGAFIADDQETLLAGGFKYEFKKGIYLTLQYQSFSSKIGANNPLDYDLNQLFVLYTMNF